MAVQLPEGIRTSAAPLDTRAAARDLWPGGTLEMWQGVRQPAPRLVAWPEDAEQVRVILERAAEAGVPVVPYGAGSGVGAGARGKPDGIALDLKAMNRIGPLNADGRWVEAEAGVMGQHLEDWLADRGYTLGHSPSSIWCSTVGGWAAARSAGQFSSRYGVFEDMVVAMQVVAPGRGVFWVGEGGDAPAEWVPLLLGSEGTLGVITRVRMRVWPAPERRWLRGYRFPNMQAATTAMRRLMQGELWPSVVRLYDPVDTRIGGRTKPKRHRAEATQKSFLRRWLRRVDRLSPVRRRSLVLPLALPGLVNRVFDGVASGCLLVVGWEGDPEVVEALSSAGHRLLCQTGEDLGAEPGERWYASRHAVSYKLMPIFERGGFADTMEVACRWSDLVPLYDAVRAAIGQTAVVMAHMSHAYPEGCSIYFSFAGRGAMPVYERTWERALEACLAHGGTISHHHGVGALKAWAASEEIGPAVRGWQEAKRDLDPVGVLNPGRLYVEGRHRAAPPPDLVPEDGLIRVPLPATFEDLVKAGDAQGVEVAWPWTKLPAPPVWQRPWWRSGWIEVAAELDGLDCRLGRGPRSATGSDLRGWLAGYGAHATATLAAVPPGERWMGEGRPERPWAVAHALLRSDLRPAVLTVQDGTLRVGFRGPAAQALGAVAAERVPGGLSAVRWQPVPLPAGPLEACALDDPAVVAVTEAGAFRPAAKEGP